MDSNRSNLHNVRLLGSVVIFVAVIILGVWYFHKHADEFKKIADIGFTSFALLSFFVILTIFVTGIESIMIVRIFRTRLSLWEGFGLSAVNTMANYYFAKAGIAAKGVYLKKKHQFPYTHYVSTVAGAYIVSLLTQGLLGIALCLLNARINGIRYEILLAFAAVSLCGLAPFLIPKFRFKKDNVLAERIERILEGWQRIKTHRSLLLVLMLLNVLYILLIAVRLKISFHALGYDAQFLSCFVMAPLWTLSVILSITPGAIGIRQALFGYSSELLDIGLTQGVMASTIDHAVNALWVFVFGLIFSYWVWRKGKSS